jgi:hypothetical protein
VSEPVGGENGDGNGNGNGNGNGDGNGNGNGNGDGNGNGGAIQDSERGCYLMRCHPEDDPHAVIHQKGAFRDRKSVV